MKSPREVKKLMTRLDEVYPTNNVCYLNYDLPWQLLFATILSAQCTDDRVNQVTRVLFKKYPTLDTVASANLADMESYVKSTGFYRNKAMNIIDSAHILLDRFGGDLPESMESLTELPGVGRKTANLVRGHIFGIPSIIVDTHVKRISFKLGLTIHTDPYKIEIDLGKQLPKEHWTRYNTQIIAHGRAICRARSPKCDECPLSNLCDMYKSASSGS